MWRAVIHDFSKLSKHERRLFAEVTPKLRGMTYGSEEYRATLRQIKPAITHHNKCNRHHPEHFENGIRGMNLVDLCEMFFDWWSATKRHDDGNIKRSVEKCQERFGYSDDMKDVLGNST